MATYGPLAGGSGGAAGAGVSGGTGAASSPRGAGDSSTSDGGAASQGTAMVFLVDLQVSFNSEGMPCDVRARPVPMRCNVCMCFDAQASNSEESAVVESVDDLVGFQSFSG